MVEPHFRPNESMNIVNSNSSSNVNVNENSLIVVEGIFRNRNNVSSFLSLFISFFNYFSSFTFFSHFQLSYNQDTRCKLKFSFNEEQFSQLLREKNILEVIRAADTLGESFQFIVTWIYSQFLIHNENQEGIYNLNEVGDFIPFPHFPLNGLVFECGESNLHQFLKNQPRIAIMEKVTIMEQIIKAVSFLHKHNIVHFDLKPENVVMFNSNYGMKWKLIDFDSSFDLNVSRSYPISELRYTKEYVSPEVMRFIKTNNNNNNNTSSNPSSEIEINTLMDIWSVGMIGVFVFGSYSLWKWLFPNSEFHTSMIVETKQEEINTLLNSRFGEKERTFLGECLQVDPVNRRSGLELKMKSLFRTDNSTISTKLTKEVMIQICNEFKDTLQKFQEEGNNYVSSELDSKLSELIMNLKKERK